MSFQSAFGGGRQNRYFAADEPVGLVPNLLPVIRDNERRQSNRLWQRRPAKKPDLPNQAPDKQRLPDSEHQLDEYA